MASTSDSVHLRGVEVLDGDELNEAASGVASDLAGEDVDLGDAGLVSRTTTIEVKTDTATLRPQWSLFDMKIVADGKTRVERRETTFDWSKAEGCGS